MNIFTGPNRNTEAQRWVDANASGDCSVLIDTTWDSAFIALVSPGVFLSLFKHGVRHNETHHAKAWPFTGQMTLPARMTAEGWSVRSDACPVNTVEPQMRNYCDCGDYCAWCRPELC